MKITAFLYALAFWLAFIGTSGASAQASETMGQEGDAELYAECQRLLDSPPLNGLGSYVSKGLGARIRSTRLGKGLLNVRCSDAQIISYMKQHGFRYNGIETWPEIMHLGGGDQRYDANKRLGFCTSHKNWLDRLLFKDCAVVAFYYLLDDTIVRIAAAGNK